MSNPPLPTTSPTPSTTSTPSAPLPTASVLPSPSGSLEPTTSASSPTPSEEPSPISSAEAGEPAWTNQAVALFPKATDDGTAQVHLGANFPINLTGQTASFEGKPWDQVTWKTPGRVGTGWLPASALTTRPPHGSASASLDALDLDLGTYLSKLGTRVGVEVLDLTRGVTYTYNADRAYLVASSMKVPIMLTFLTQLEAKGREPTTRELSLLTTMIENSNNDSASALFKAIGYEVGINAFMHQVGISGLTVSTRGTGWGWSVITPAAMVALLLRLHEGTVLNANHRALALKLMEHIEADQRVGVGDSSPAGATIALKDGWVSGPDDLMVMNSSGIVTLGKETYILAVYTVDDDTLNEGFTIVRHICKVIGVRLVGTA